MNNNLKNFLRKCQFPLIIALETAPIPLTLFSFLSADLFPFAWAFLGLFTLLSIFAIAIPGKFRKIWGVLGCLMILGLTVLALSHVRNFFMLIATVLYLGLFVWSLQIGSWSWDTELHSFWMWTGIVIHLIFQLILAAARVSNITQTAIAEPGILVCFFLFAFFAMLSLNRDSMSTASMGQQKVSKSMRGKNLVFTLGFFVIAFLVTLIPSLIDAVKKAWKWLLDVTIVVVKWLIAHYPSGTNYSTGQSAEDVTSAVDMSGAEASKFALFMEVVIKWVLIGIYVIIIIIFLIFVVKKLIQLIKYLWNKVNRFGHTISEDYEDTVTDTRDSGDKEGTFMDRLRSRIAEADETGLTPTQKIRRRYLRIMKKHPEWAAGTTAREKLSDQAANIYERARYSQHSVSEEDVTAFQTGTKRI